MVKVQSACLGSRHDRMYPVHVRFIPTQENKKQNKTETDLKTVQKHVNQFFLLSGYESYPIRGRGWNKSGLGHFEQYAVKLVEKTRRRAWCHV